MGAGGLGAALVIGIIMIIAGFLGFGFSDPFSDPTGWYILIGLGFVLVIGGILYVTALSATAKTK